MKKMSYHYFVKNFKTNKTSFGNWECHGKWNDSTIYFMSSDRYKVRIDAYNGLIAMGYLKMDKKIDKLLKIIIDKVNIIERNRNKNI